MIPHPAPAEPTRPADQAAEDALYYRGVLHELIDLGADLARLVHGQAKAQVEAEAGAAGAGDGAGMGTAPDLAAAFDRLARAVRRSISLARTLSDPVRPPAAHDDDARRTAARKRIIREVEDTIQRKVGAGDAEALHEELLDRLDAPDLDDDIRDRPVADIIAEICRDLGLAAMPGTRPWKRRGPAELATLRARAAAPRAAPVASGLDGLRPSSPPGELRWPPGAGATPGLVVPPARGLEASDPAANDPSSGLGAGPATPLLSAARFRGK